MEDEPIAEGHSVFFLEESVMLQTLFDSWLPHTETRFGSDPDEILHQFDETTAVACLSKSVIGDEEAQIRNHILNRNPYCQLVLIAPRSAFITPFESNYHACLRRPVLKEELQQTVSDRLRCGVYSILLREFYALNTKLIIASQRGVTVDVVVDVSQDQFRDRYQEIGQQLNALKQGLSAEDLASIAQSMDLHKRYQSKPVRESNPNTGSKYHPSRCPKCKLPWGVKHGNDLGTGLVSVGAGVWKCTRCREIVHGLGEGGRRVMRG